MTPGLPCPLSAWLPPGASAEAMVLPAAARPAPTPARGAPALAGAILMALALPARAEGPLPLMGPLPVRRASALTAEEVPAALSAFEREAAHLQQDGAELLAHYQRFIQVLEAEHLPAKASRSPEECRALPLWEPWQGARASMAEFKGQARVTRAAVRDLEDYEAAGYAAGLTPDLRRAVAEATHTWDSLSAQHASFQAILTHQMAPEVARLGCDPAWTEASVTATAAAAAPGPTPGAEGAPPAVDAAAPAPAPAAPEAETARAQAPAPAVMVALSDPHPPPFVPPAPEARWGQALAAPAPAPATTPPPLEAQPSAASPVAGSPLTVTFVIDNTGCGKDLEVFVDGARAGAVPAFARAAFKTAEGPHKVCVAPGAAQCAGPEGAIDALMYEGWSMRPGC